MTIARLFAAAAILVTLAACGGGDGAKPAGSAAASAKPAGSAAPAASASAGGW